MILRWFNRWLNRSFSATKWFFVKFGGTSSIVNK